MGDSEWTEHLFDNLQYDEPGFGNWDDDTFYAAEEPEPSYETYDHWADRISKEKREKSKRATDPYEEYQAKKRKIQEEERIKLEQELKSQRERVLETTQSNYFKSVQAFKQSKELGLGWRDVPWPLSVPKVRSLKTLETQLTQESIESFLNGAMKSQIKDLLLLFHPDKFIKYEKVIKVTEWNEVLRISTLVSKSLTFVLSK